MEGGELLLSQTIQSGGRLLGGGIGGELAFARRLAGEIRMAVDQRALALIAGIAHGVGHGLIERRDAGKGALGVSFVRHPRRKLHHFADRRHEGGAVGGIERIERNRVHLRPHRTAQAVAPSW